MAEHEPQYGPPIKTVHTKAYPGIDPSRPELSTRGKNIVITGGGRGIGVGMAESFARSGASNIALISRSEASLQKVKETLHKAYPNTAVHAITADQTDAASISSALKTFTESVEGKIDILVANAGYLHHVVPFDAVDPDDWWKGFEINVKGAFNLLRAFTPLAAPGAVIVHISTAGAHVPLLPHHHGYQSSKLAATKVFECYKFEHPGIRVHNVHPGAIETDMLAQTFAAGVVLPLDDPDLPGPFVNWIASDEAAFLDGKFVWSGWDIDELKELPKRADWEDLFRIGLQGFVFPLAQCLASKPEKKDE